jgi:hypothetical protein
MRFFTYLLGGLLLGLILALVVTTFASETIQVCTATDGSITYTNKNQRGCSAVTLPELSVIPTRNIPVVPLSPQVSVTEEKAPSVNDGICALYEEWMTLASRTLGGFAHNTIQDTQRRLVLVQLFGGGFAPNSCH